MVGIITAVEEYKAVALLFFMPLIIDAKSLDGKLHAYDDVLIRHVTDIPCLNCQ